MNKITLAALVLTASAVVAGDWPNGRKDPERRGYNGETARPPLTLRWTSAPTGGRILSSPVVSSGTVYVGSQDNKVYAFNAYTGAQLWSYATGGFVDSTPAVSSGSLYVGSHDGYLYSLNAKTGTLRWRVNTGGREISSPAEVRGELCMGSGHPNQTILRLNAFNGEILSTRLTAQYVYGTPSCTSSLIAAGSNDGNFYFLNPNTGSDLYSPYSTEGRIFRSAMVQHDGRVFGVSGDYQRTLYAFSDADGSLLWSAELDVSSPSAVSSPAVSPNGVYVAATALTSSKTKLFAFDPVTGASKAGFTTYETGTTATAKDYAFTSSPALANGVIYLADADGKLHVIDEATGAALTAAITVGAGSALLASVAVANGWVYVASFDGKVYAYQADELASIADPSDVGEIFALSTASVRGMIKPAGGATFTNFSLEYGVSTAPASYTEIASNQTGVSADGTLVLLGSWTVSGLSDGLYTLRLTANFSNATRTVLHPVNLANGFAKALGLSGQALRVTASDGSMVELPVGALSQDDTLSIAVSTSYPAGAPEGITATGIVREIKLGKTTTRLDKPAVVRLAYRFSEIAGINPSRLRLYTYDDGSASWVLVNGSQPDTSSRLVIGEVNHFSLFQLMAYAPLAANLIVPERIYSTPNPARGGVITFKVYLNDDADIKVSIYTMAGAKVGEISGQGLGGNVAIIPWTMGQLASGVYIYKVEAKSSSEIKTVTKKLAVIH